MHASHLRSTTSLPLERVPMRKGLGEDQERERRHLHLPQAPLRETEEGLERMTVSYR